VAEIEFCQPNIAQKLNSSTNVEPIFVSRHNANAVLCVRFYFPMSMLYSFGIVTPFK
jgi:hypothetical protein